MKTRINAIIEGLAVRCTWATMLFYILIITLVIPRIGISLLKMAIRDYEKEKLKRNDKSIDKLARELYSKHGKKAYQWMNGHLPGNEVVEYVDAPDWVVDAMKEYAIKIVDGLENQFEKVENHVK